MAEYTDHQRPTFEMSLDMMSEAVGKASDEGLRDVLKDLSERD